MRYWNFIEITAYDNLNQITSFDRGELNSTKDGIVGTPSRSQDWDFDALGNFDSVTTDSSTQTRDHDAQNQITSISGATTPTYDSNGNMTGDESGNTLIYDAWNRLVEVKDGMTTLVSYSHDALNRRVTEDDGTERVLYYSDQWQVLEERESGNAVIQYVWSPVYVDAMVLRDRDTDSNGSLDERFYVQHDANFNVTALLDTSGNVMERFVYDPFGAATVLTPGWTTRSSSDYGWQYLHQGGRLDATTGFYEFRFRWYSPTLGRWIQVDPIGLGAADANLYRALGNRPTNGLDPDGLKVWYIDGADGQWRPIAYDNIPWHQVSASNPYYQAWYMSFLGSSSGYGPAASWGQEAMGLAALGARPQLIQGVLGPQPVQQASPYPVAANASGCLVSGAGKVAGACRPSLAPAKAGCGDFLPVFGTFTNILTQPAGSDPSDYASCATSVMDIRNLGREAAIVKCEKCIDAKVSQYLVGYVGPGILRSGLELTAAIIVAKRYISGVATSSWNPILAGGLALDATINVGVTIAKIHKIGEGGKKAKERYCK